MNRSSGTHVNLFTRRVQQRRFRYEETTTPDVSDSTFHALKPGQANDLPSSFFIGRTCYCSVVLWHLVTSNRGPSGNDENRTKKVARHECEAKRNRGTGEEKNRLEVRPFDWLFERFLLGRLRCRAGIDYRLLNLYASKGCSGGVVQSRHQGMLLVKCFTLTDQPTT